VLDVPAPISVLTSVAVIPEFKDGAVPLDSIAGTPVSGAELVIVILGVVVLFATEAVIPVPAVTATDVTVPTLLNPGTSSNS
jgi:hypothetical protein